MIRPTLINLLLALVAFLPTTMAFAPIQRHKAQTSRYLAEAEGGDDQNEIVARRIIVKGDVQGGYYRSCVLNEVSSSVMKISLRRSCSCNVVAFILSPGRSISASCRDHDSTR